MSMISKRLQKLGDRVDSLVMQRCAYEAADTIDALVAALEEARTEILLLVNARWSGAEGTDAEWVEFIDAALAKAKGKQA